MAAISEFDCNNPENYQTHLSNSELLNQVRVKMDLHLEDSEIINRKEQNNHNSRSTIWNVAVAGSPSLKAGTTILQKNGGI